jgi:hypothetical protein
MRKLRFHTIVDLVVFAARNGIMQIPTSPINSRAGRQSCLNQLCIVPLRGVVGVKQLELNDVPTQEDPALGS